MVGAAKAKPCDRHSTYPRRVTVFVDADGSHDLCDIPRLIEPIRQGEADHVTASRLLGGSSELHGGFDEFFRLPGSSFITACINWRFGVRLSDSQNGFRAIRTCVLRELALRENHTTIEQEMIMRTLRLGYRIAEVPSHESARALRLLARQCLARRSPLRLVSLLRNLFCLMRSPARASMPLNILGIWDGHDAGAALLAGGRLVAAVNEERLTRRKLEIRFPHADRLPPALRSRASTLARSTIVAVSTSDIAKTLGTAAAIGERALLRWCDDARRSQAFQHVRTSALKYAIDACRFGRSSRRRSAAMRSRADLRRAGIQTSRIEIFDHHECHAWSAACAIGIRRRCAVLTIDGLGDGLSATISRVPQRSTHTADLVTSSPLPRRVLRARDDAAQHARARRRGQGDGAGRLRHPGARR